GRSRARGGGAAHHADLAVNAGGVVARLVEAAVRVLGAGADGGAGGAEGSGGGAAGRGGGTGAVAGGQGAGAGLAGAAGLGDRRERQAAVHQLAGRAPGRRRAGVAGGGA